MADLPLHGYVQNQLRHLKLGKTAQDVLQEFIDIDATTDDIARILKNNPGQLQIFERFVNETAKKGPTDAQNEAPAKDASGKEEKKAPANLPPTFRLIALVGLIGSRNFILALRLLKLASGTYPPPSEENMNFKPSDYLKYSYEVEELCQRNRINYGETWFAGAYLFDWLNTMAKRTPHYKKLEPFMQQTWKQARSTAIIAHSLAEKVPNFSLFKYAGAAGMICHAGKVLLALETLEGNETNYLAEREKLAKLDWKPLLEAELLLERDQYGITHEELSAFITLYFRIFKDLEKAVRYRSEPFYLKKIDKNSYLLACILNLATNMARTWKTPVDDKDPIMAEWRKPWLKDLKLTSKNIIDTMKWSMNLK